MRIKIKKTTKTEWHKWFAWHPIITNDEIIWLEKINRRMTESYMGGGEFITEIEYKTK